MNKAIGWVLLAAGALLVVVVGAHAVGLIVGAVNAP